jgi:hypothetical protein
MDTFGYDKMYFLLPRMVKNDDNDSMIGLNPNICTLCCMKNCWNTTSKSVVDDYMA